MTFGQVLENLRKVIENRKKNRHQYVYNKNNIKRYLEDMNFMFSWQEQYFKHKIHIFSPPCNILSRILGFDYLALTPSMTLSLQYAQFPQSSE